VESEPTPREQAALVAVRELRDADRALGRRGRRPGAAAATGRGGGRRVDEDGQRGDGQLHPAPVPGLGRRRRRRGHRRRVVLAVAAGARAREEAAEVDEEDVKRDEARREQPPVCLPVDSAGRDTAGQLPGDEDPDPRRGRRIRPKGPRI